jgi:apolipoprotein N-acyltransferase
LDAVIWPESATPFFLEQEPVLRDKIRLIIPHGGYLMVGGLRLGYINHTQRHWNSLLVINDRGSVVATYDKAHLVPFGEYVPFRETLSLIIPPSWLQKVTPGSDDFDAGFGPKTIAQTSLPPFSPLICYEAIFPGEVADAVAYPAWLLNVSNDGWFGLSSGPPQHLVSATFRAVEEGIPMMRAANTGISAVIDSYGRIVTSIPLQETGIVDAYLPRPATDEPFFRHYGNRIFWVMVVLLSLMIRLPRKRLSTKGSDHAT